MQKKNQKHADSSRWTAWDSQTASFVQIVTRALKRRRRYRHLYSQADRTFPIMQHGCPLFSSPAWLMQTHLNSTPPFLTSERSNNHDDATVTSSGKLLKSHITERILHFTDLRSAALRRNLCGKNSFEHNPGGVTRRLLNYKNISLIIFLLRNNNNNGKNSNNF